MTDAHREEAETGKYALWVYIKNWIADYLKSTDLNLDGSKNLGVNVITFTEETPDAATKNNPSYSMSYDGNGRLQYLNLTFDATTWRKTFTYTSGRLTGISTWVEQ
jgi:hypothetical protein